MSGYLSDDFYYENDNNISTVNTVLIEASAILKEVECLTSELDARILLEHCLGLTTEKLFSSKDRILSSSEQKNFDDLIERRKNREPVAQIIGRRSFWKEEFKTTCDTLDPRPDSETLIESVLKFFPDKTASLKILDLGTGTGCLLLSLLGEYKSAVGTGADISEKALSVAKENASALGFKNRSEFIISDWGNSVKGKFDIIICNPPYIKHKDIKNLMPEVYNYDPHIALDGGNSGLDAYQKIIPQLLNLPNKNGVAFLEIGQNQENDISQIIQENGFSIAAMERDLGGIIRCLVVNR